MKKTAAIRRKSPAVLDKARFERGQKAGSVTADCAVIQTLVDNANDLIQSVTADGKIIYANQKWLDILGYSQADLPALNLSGIIRSDELPHCQTLLQRVIGGEKLEFIETVFKTREGREVIVEGNVSGCFKEGKFTSTLGIFRDITGRKMAENIYNLLVLNSPLPVYVVQGGVFRFVNASFVNVIGYPQSKLLGKKSLDFVHPQDREYVYNSAVRMLKTNRSSNYEFRMIRSDGEVRWVMESLMSISYEGGRATLGTVVDLTERKMVESALQEAKERYQTIFNSVKDAIFIVDMQNKFLEVNDAACNLLGYSRSEFFKGLIGDSPLFFASRREMGESGYFEADSEVVTRKGKRVPVEYLSHCMEYEKRKAVLIVVRDISDRKQAENIRRRNQARLESVVRIAQFKTGYVRDLLYFTLEEVIRLTQSSIGFLYLYHPGRREFALSSWSKELMKRANESYNAKKPPKAFALKQEGILAEVVRQGKPLIINQSQAPGLERNGYPEGNYPIEKSLVVPVFFEKEVAAVVSLANKEGDYDQVDIQQTTSLLASAWNIMERWRAEEGLRDSEQRYRQLIELSQDAILRMDAQGTIVMANPAACRMFGYSAEEMQKTSLEKTFIPEDRHLAAEHLVGLEPGKPVRFERLALRKDGSSFPIEVSLSPLTQGYFQEMVRDITNRKRAEGQLKYQAMLIDSVSDAIFSTDLESRILSWNRGAETIFGWSQAEAVGKYVQDILMPENAEGDIDALVDLVLKTGSVQAELVQMRKDGSRVYTLALTSLIKDAQGKVIGLINVSRDISERKKMENALAESAKKYRMLVENQTDLLVEINIRKELLFVNPAYCKLMGKTEKEMLGTDMTLPVMVDEREVFRKELENVFQPPFNAYSQAQMDTRNGLRWIAWTFNAVRDAQGDLSSITCLGRDITERKLASDELEKANEQLRELDRLKDNFLSTVSHELRTPLTSIKSFAEILLNYDEDKATQKEFLGIINDESDRLTRLINDFLDLSKIQAGRMQWQTVELSMEEAIRAATNSARPLIEKAKLELLMYVEPDLPHVLSDKDRLIQVITNILGNSIKFTPENGKLTLRAWSDKKGEGESGDWVTVSLTDTGIGIAAENHQKIFEKFGQVGDVLKDRPKGTGLGLPICKKIVENYGGRIWLQSALGKGTTFFFSLPAVKEKNADGPSPGTALLSQEIRSLSGKSILVVDDEPNIRRFLQHELSSRGHHVIEAANGKEGVDSARRFHPDLITLDISMPDLNGFDVTAVLKNDPETKNIPIFIVSVIEDKQKAYRLGADDYITKPINTEIFVEKVNRLLGRPAA